MSSGEFLQAATQKLAEAGIETARLDCLVLLEDCLNKDRTQLLAHPEMDISGQEISLLNQRIARRALHEPLAYIREKAEFYGRNFLVNVHTLVPRPETETLIDMTKAVAMNKSSVRIADIGCGSGCIGITLAHEIPHATIALYDIDEAALAVAAQNVAQHNLNIEARKSDLLKQVMPANLIVANLPYVPMDFAVNEAVRFEPPQAVFSGKDGLDLYRQFWQQLGNTKQKPEIILTESLPEQHAILAGLASNAGFRLAQTQDFIQQFVAKI